MITDQIGQGIHWEAGWKEDLILELKKKSGLMHQTAAAVDAVIAADVMLWNLNLKVKSFAVVAQSNLEYGL